MIIYIYLFSKIVSTDNDDGERYNSKILRLLSKRINVIQKYIYHKINKLRFKSEYNCNKMNNLLDLWTHVNLNNMIMQ